MNKLHRVYVGNTSARKGVYIYTRMYWADNAISIDEATGAFLRKINEEWPSPEYSNARVLSVEDITEWLTDKGWTPPQEETCAPN